MKNRQGFTLTEILLAVMIVGIIGVALASLTTAASRESGAGNSRVMLRNNFSIALRQLRQDVHGASRILFAQGAMSTAPAQSESPNQVPLLVLANNLSVLNEKIDTNANIQFIAYCFTRGGTTTLSSGDDVQPKDNSYDGGKITREVWTGDTLPTSTTACQSTKTGRTISTWLSNVKFISNSYTYDSKHYPVPLFSLVDFNRETTYNNSWSLAGEGAVLDVKVIVELPSAPVVNEVVEERMLLSNSGKLTNN